MARRVVVIGAGPIGLSAAPLAAERGSEVTVLEQGQVGDALHRWGPTRLFTPLRMNLPAAATAALGRGLPSEDALLTGPEMADAVLKPLAARPPLRGRVRARHRVVAVGRAGLTRGDLPGHPLRAERPFQILADTPEGQRLFEAEAVLDASGVYGRPAAAGAGGLPARGEALLGSRFIRDLGTLHTRLDSLKGREILMLGHGHSAANALLVLEDLAARAPATRVTWATRSANRRPCAEVAADPLPERARVASRANDLAQDPPPFLEVERCCALEAVAAEGERLRVALSGGRERVFDEIVAMTGYRPDHSFLSELALEIAPANEGAARLSRALANVTDCLAVPRVEARDLESGEPGFHLVGSKSYGRARTFLLQTGIAHLESIMEGVEWRRGWDSNPRGAD